MVPEAGMRALFVLYYSLLSLAALPALSDPSTQTPLIHRPSPNRRIPVSHFDELEELARLVDITYCVGNTGVWKPFRCASRCRDFPNFELVTTWSTGPLLSDSCGYIVLSHPPSPPRILVAFRGTYSLANTIADLSSLPQPYVPYPGGSNDANAPSASCPNCTVHTGFYLSYQAALPHLLPHIDALIAQYPSYALTLVGHSLGGAIAALTALNFEARGWRPRVTTFGEPRVGNEALARYFDARFDIPDDALDEEGEEEVAEHRGSKSRSRYARVTHAGDPVPLLPLTKMGYASHAGEVYISKGALPPSVADVEYCAGDADPGCVAASGLGSRASVGAAAEGSEMADMMMRSGADGDGDGDGDGDVNNGGEEAEGGEDMGGDRGWRVEQLFLAHRDYFWRLGLCVPGGDPGTGNWAERDGGLSDGAREDL